MQSGIGGEAPTSEQARIESLDVLRGFALLGILLLNIVGFGLISSAYSNPAQDMASSLDLAVWASVEISAEGAMRALFSMLFGAGVVLFAGGETGRGAALHYKRTFWLLVFGLFDAFILLWTGDILITYAVVGGLLYFVRNAGGKRLIIAALSLMILLGGMYALSSIGLQQGQVAAKVIAANDAGVVITEQDRELAEVWHSTVGDFQLTPDQQVAELSARQTSYASAFAWNKKKTIDAVTFVLPVIMFWDALAFMLLGMGLYQLGILQGQRSSAFYVRLAVAGFAVGILVNGYEVNRAISSDLAFIESFAYGQPTYHLGRLGMAVGYMSVLILTVKQMRLPGLRIRLAAVGRMALTNYLMHSVICLFIFTGAGFGLTGELARAQLYLVVFAIWILQLLLSPWWLERYRFGPVEWLWRGLTYGSLPNLRRAKSDK